MNSTSEKKKNPLASCYVPCSLSKVQQLKATEKPGRVFNETEAAK